MATQPTGVPPSTWAPGGDGLSHTHIPRRRASREKSLFLLGMAAVSLSLVRGSALSCPGVCSSPAPATRPQGGCGPYPRDGGPHHGPELAFRSPTRSAECGEPRSGQLCPVSPAPPSSTPRLDPAPRGPPSPWAGIMAQWPSRPSCKPFGGPSPPTRKAHLLELTFRASPDLPTAALPLSCAPGPELPATSCSQPTLLPPWGPLPQETPCNTSVEASWPSP